MRYEIVNGVLLLQYETRISSLMFLAMGSYFVLPLIAASIQAVYYGWALIDLAIGISMVLMFLAAAKEQNEELLQLETSRAQLAEKLEIATVLNRCVEKLSGCGQDVDKATHELLGVINDYFCADRSYVFELDTARDVVVNTHEFVVVRSPVAQERFEQQVADLRAALARRGVDAAIGSVWKPAVEDVAAFLHEADERMYREKEKR